MRHVKLTISSPELSPGMFPRELTCDGANRAPRLGRSTPPAGTQELAIEMLDPVVVRGHILRQQERKIMAGGYTEELVYTKTDDGLSLAGIMMRPEPGAARSGLDTWFLRSYDLPQYAVIGRRMAAEGYVFVSGSNHGRDVGAVLWQPWLEGEQGSHPNAHRPFLRGSRWEPFDESRPDVAAWIDLVAANGVSEVVLIGQSFGAIKVVYSLAERRDPRGPFGTDAREMLVGALSSCASCPLSVTVATISNRDLLAVPHGVTIAEWKTGAELAVGHPPDELTRWLDHPGTWWIRGAPGKLHAASAQLEMDSSGFHEFQIRPYRLNVA